jgi:hypothetical protein
VYDYAVEQSRHIINEYEGRVELFERNMLPIIVRCNTEEIEVLKQTTKEKLKEISANCLNFVNSALLT